MTSQLFVPQLMPCLDHLVPARHPELQRMEAEAAKTNFPIIGPAAGQLCYLVARLVGARSVFELGSGFGYSTAWFARAVSENGGGVVHHTVWDEALSARARSHLAVLGLVDPASLPAIKERLRPGGVLIVDNLLWSGKVFDATDRSADTEGVRELTRLVMSDPDWTSSVVPIRDGVLVARLGDRPAN